MPLCPSCEQRPDLGEPSQARWLGPDGGIYCSLHFIQTFGHGERLVKIADFEPPADIKPPAEETTSGTG
jgi:hypothetical protein